MGEWKQPAADDAVVVLRDPGTTALGEDLRKILLDPDRKAEPSTIFFGFCAARSELLAEIRRRLLQGYTVIADRLWPSTLAYQGYGSGIPIDLILEASRYLMETYIPLDQHIHYVFLDASPALRESRLVGERGKDRFESTPADFRRRVDTGYAKARTIAGNLTAHVTSVVTHDVTTHSPRAVVDTIVSALPRQWQGEILINNCKGAQA
jgi:dTMP kinase